MKLYNVGKRLQEARRKKGIKTQESFASKANVTLKTVQNWEQGRVNPSLETLIELSELLDCDLDYLTGRIDESTHDIHYVQEMTGLSEEAIRKISNPDIDNPMGKLLSHLIESDGFYNLMMAYKIFLTSTEKLGASDIEEPPFELNEGDRVILSCNEAAHHFMSNVALGMTHICEEDYDKHLDIALQKAQKQKIEHFQKLASMKGGSDSENT